MRFFSIRKCSITIERDDVKHAINQRALDVENDSIEKQLNELNYSANK